MDASGQSLNKSTFEERQRNIGYLRKLYLFFSLQTLLWLVWTSFCLCFEDYKFGKWIKKTWWMALTTSILTAILQLVASFVPAVRKNGPNFGVYQAFTLFGAYSVGYLCLWDKNSLLFFALCLITAIAFAFECFAFCSTSYMQTMSAILFILGSSSVVYQIFIIFTDTDLVFLTLVMIMVVVFGFYLNYDIRRMVRGNLYDVVVEDAVTGAVRIWMETVLVFCRLVELIGGMFVKSKH